MANWFEPDKDVVEDFYKWLESRPQAVREVARRFPPWELFRMQSTGHRVTVHGFSQHVDDGRITLMVDVTGRFNLVVMERRVFGVDPEDLEPCELPAKDEKLGSLDVPIEELRKRMNIKDEGEEEE